MCGPQPPSYELDTKTRIGTTATIPMSVHAGLGEQLALIEAKATALRQKAFERI